MKLKIVSCILCIIILLMINTGLVSAQDRIESFNKVAENEYLALYLNEDTTEIAVKDKSNN